jgi:hypothetical protein
VIETTYARNQATNKQCKVCAKRLGHDHNHKDNYMNVTKGAPYY